jgi:hypothetical protein
VGDDDGVGCVGELRGGKEDSTVFTVWCYEIVGSHILTVEKYSALCLVGSGGTL